MNFQKLFNDNLDTLRNLLKINSIYDSTSASSSAPYGKGPKDALLFMKELALKDGFIVKEYDNQVISISYVDNETDRIDIASHLDVVSVDDTWNHDPFGAIIENGKIYGRGTSDMKTAAFLTYLCLKLLRENYPKIKREIRIVLGSDEERTMNDMRLYKKMVCDPKFAFSPDGSFPMGIGEKGALMWTLKGEDNGIIESLEGGIQCNVVAPSARAVLKNNQYTNKLKEYVKDNKIDATISEKDNKTVMNVMGQVVHCSRNWLGKNACTILFKMLGDVTNDALSKNLSDCFYPNFGEGFNSKQGDGSDYCLTVNLGKIEIKDGKVFAQIDCRYPKTITSDVITKNLKEKCHYSISLDYDDPATLCDINDPYVKTMLETYYEITHENAKPFVSGGVSYSKVFGHCVTFGMCKPGKPMMAHQKDEYVEMQDAIEAFEIYYKTIERLALLKEDR